MTAISHAGVPVFEPPLPLEADTNQSPAGEGNRDAVAATSGSGTWVVAWSSGFPLLGSLPGDNDIHFARSTDHGLTFSERNALNSDAGTDKFLFGDMYHEIPDELPSLAADTTGTFMAVWGRTDFSRPVYQLIEFSRSNNDGSTWSPLSVLATDGYAPAIATDGSGTWIIAWVHHASVLNEDIHFTRSTNGGVTWSPPAKLNVRAEGDPLGITRPRVSWAAGVWIVSWSTIPYSISSTNDANIFIRRSTDGGATWSAPSSFHAFGDDDVAWDNMPHVAGDEAGNWVLAWSSSLVYGSEQSDIFFARSSDHAATWSAPEKLDTDSEHAALRVHLAAGSPGTFVAVWDHHSPDPESDRNLIDVMMAASTDAGATWSPRQPLSDAGHPYYVHALYPHVAYDPAGHWLSLWSSNDERLASGTKGGDEDIVMALGDFACGNGVPDAGEQCDTGRRGDLDCCSRSCTLEPAGAVCAADAELCTLERCDGGGTCDHLPAAAGTHCTPDSDLCTFDRCDSAATCEHVAAPRDDCKKTSVTGASRLQMQSDGTADGSSIQWKWSRGEPTVPRDVVFAIGAWDYALCMFDDAGLAARIDAPNYLDCFTGDDGDDCWSTGSGRQTSLRYSVPEGIPNGMTKLSLKTAGKGKAKISLLAEGANLQLPGLPVTGFPLKLQLVNDKEACWEATYSTPPSENSPVSFNARSD
jgi:hypothetical protein